MTKNTTPNTSHHSTKQRRQQRSDSPTVQKRRVPGETRSGEKSLSLPEDIVKIFLMTDLKSWTFKLKERNEQDSTYDAFHAPVEIWVQWASQYADLDPMAVCGDMEERDDFLTKLWTYCKEEGLPFPLEEKSSENQIAG